MIYVYLILFILLFLVLIQRQKINNKEHFIGLYENLNQYYMNNKNKKEIKIIDNNQSKQLKNFHSLFLKNIYLTQIKNKKTWNFYFLNYKYQPYLKVQLKLPLIKNNITIYDEKNQEQVGFLKNHKYNKYIFDLQKLYKKNYIFEIQNNYEKIKIYGFYLDNIYYLTKNKDIKKIYTCYLFEKEIGYVNQDEESKSFKINIENKYIDQINLFGLALILVQLNT